jgi:broad specificity phosphatase PhoE
MSLRVYLIRHGQTASNAAGVLQGHLPIPLNELGLAQAERLAFRAADLEPRVERLFASDLRRAQETAEPIERCLGLVAELDTRWRERAFGPLEGTAVGDTEVWRAASGTLDPPGAESLDHLRQRVAAVMNALSTGMRGGAVAVVTHGGVIRTALSLLASGGLPLAPGETAPEVGVILNGSIAHLEVDTAGWRVLRVNDVDHLASASEPTFDQG